MSIYFIESFNPILLNYENYKILPRRIVGGGEVSVPYPIVEGPFRKVEKILFVG